MPFLCCPTPQALEYGYWLRQQYIDTHSFLPASFKQGGQRQWRRLYRAGRSRPHRKPVWYFGGCGLAQCTANRLPLSTARDALATASTYDAAVCKLPRPLTCDLSRRCAPQASKALSYGTLKDVMYANREPGPGAVSSSLKGSRCNLCAALVYCTCHGPSCSFQQHQFPCRLFKEGVLQKRRNLCCCPCGSGLLAVPVLLLMVCYQVCLLRVPPTSAAPRPQ